MKTCYNVAPFTLITSLLVGTKRSMSVENICLLCFSPAGPNSKANVAATKNIITVLLTFEVSMTSSFFYILQYLLLKASFL